MRIMLAALAVALAAPIAVAQQPNADGFYRYTTDTGCVFLLDLEPQEDDQGHIWSENCRPGELISGTGSMITKTDSYVDERGANVQDARIRTGPWVNGLMHGRFKFDNATSTNGGPWTAFPMIAGKVGAAQSSSPTIWAPLIMTLPFGAMSTPTLDPRRSREVLRLLRRAQERQSSRHARR